MKASLPPEGGVTVLVVDDYEDNRQMYAELLSYAGFAVIEASNGAEGLATAQTVLPDLIVMDLSLPVMDGWEATRRLKSDARTKHIPHPDPRAHRTRARGARGPLGGCRRGGLRRVPREAVFARQPPRDGARCSRSNAAQGPEGCHPARVHASHFRRLTPARAASDVARR
jgi:hypothetical protein